MKNQFEKLTDPKFQAFETSAIKNLNIILGGVAIPTEGPNSHDVGKTVGQGGIPDGVVSCGDGTTAHGDLR